MLPANMSDSSASSDASPLMTRVTRNGYTTNHAPALKALDTKFKPITSRTRGVATEGRRPSRISAMREGCNPAGGTHPGQGRRDERNGDSACAEEHGLQCQHVREAQGLYAPADPKPASPTVMVTAVVVTTVCWMLPTVT